MVAISTIRAANAALSKSSISQAAVFLGATSGIGQGALKVFVKSATSPKVYVVGRSASSAATLLAELKELNSNARVTFLEAQIALLKDVDRVCGEIKQKEKQIDLLFTSAGALNAGGRKETPEGLDITLSVSYYSRIRFITNLLPLLRAAPAPRVLSVLAAGKEAPIVMDDLELKTHYSLATEASQHGTMNALFMARLARENPHVAFVYTYPGLVKTALLGTMGSTLTGAWAPLRLVVSAARAVAMLFAFSAEEAGQRAVYAATDARYATPGELKRVDEYQEDAVAVPVLSDEGVVNTVYEHTLEVFARICGN